MNKAQLAEALAEALNILNGLQCDLSPIQQNEVFALFALIPSKAREVSDFVNNGTINAAQLLKAKE